MSILIKGMEMPKDCPMCQLSHWDFTGQFRGCKAVKDKRYAMETEPEYFDSNCRPPWCPLVSVPPHGRLIEERRVLDIVYEWCPDDDGSVGKDGDLREMLDEIEALPTIIEAEDEE